MTKIKILVVEDESIVAKDIQKSLEKLGYEVPATASSAASAYEKLEQILPDLVFLDIKLKGEEDGIHIAEHIKEKYNIPVIFGSGRFFILEPILAMTTFSIIIYGNSKVIIFYKKYFDRIARCGER